MQVDFSYFHDTVFPFLGRIFAIFQWFGSLNFNQFIEHISRTVYVIPPELTNPLNGEKFTFTLTLAQEFIWDKLLDISFIYDIFYNFSNSYVQFSALNVLFAVIGTGVTFPLITAFLFVPALIGLFTENIVVHVLQAISTSLNVGFLPAWLVLLLLAVVLMLPIALFKAIRKIFW